MGHDNRHCWGTPRRPGRGRAGSRAGCRTVTADPACAGRRPTGRRNARTPRTGARPRRRTPGRPAASSSANPCIAGNRQTQRRPRSPNPCRTLAAASGAVGFSMNVPVRRAGCLAAAAATDGSSPGTLAMRAARVTPCRSSSATQRSASAAGVPGASHPSAAGRSTAGSRAGGAAGSRPSVAKNPAEKKWQCASLRRDACGPVIGVMACGAAGGVQSHASPGRIAGAHRRARPRGFAYGAPAV